MDSTQGPDVMYWTSSRRRCGLRKKMHKKISSSQNPSDTAASTIRRLIKEYTFLKAVLDDELGTAPFAKQACYEILAMSAHLCESYEITNPDIVNTVISEMFTSFNNNGVWFQFLNPFGNVNSTITTDSLYPFKPVWKNYNGLREKTWITKRHLKALEYFLDVANKQLFLIRNDFASEDRGQSYFVPDHKDSNTCNPPVVLVHQSKAEADNLNCINGYYLTLRPNLQAAFHRKVSQTPSTSFANPTYNPNGEVFMDSNSDTTDHSTDSEALSPLHLFSGDDAEVSKITEDLASTVQTVELNGNGRYIPVCEYNSDSSSYSSCIPDAKRRNSSTNTNVESVGMVGTSPIFSNDSNPHCDGSQEPTRCSKDVCKEIKDVAVQTCTYTAVTLVNFPLESSVMGTMTPLTLACLQGAPEATLLLLRYGASPMHAFSRTECCMHDINQPIYATVNQLNLFSNDILIAFKNYKNALISLKQNKEVGTDVKVSKNMASAIFRDGSRVGYHCSVMFNRGCDWLKCLAHLSMVMKVWPPMMTEENTSTHDCPASGTRLPIQFAEYLPEMCRGKEPPCLQHLSRCIIRDQLGLLRKLPKGIHTLPLPTAIKNYIDLIQ